MNTQTQSLTTLLILATISVASCEDQPLAPEPAGPTTSTHNSSTVSDSGTESGDGDTHTFQLEIVPVGLAALRMYPKVDRAAVRWREVLRDTDLPDVHVGAGQSIRCGGLAHQTQSEILDDLLVLVSVREIDGPGGIVAASTLCMVRHLSFLPLVAAIFLDRTDMDDLSDADLEDVVLHELGHTLGIGTIWHHTGLLALASLFSPGADTHFAGAHAMEAFDSAGGTDYTGGKVPVENTMGYGSSDTHWRESVLGLELMTPVQRVGDSDPFSAITIGSLADLGYTVDATLADDYELGEAEADLAVPDGLPGATIDLGGDIRHSTVEIVDTDGRVVRRIVPR